MKYVIFDIDGTLTNTKKVEEKCFMEAFETTFHLNINDQKWEDLDNVTDWGITEEILLRERQRKPTPSEYQSMVSNFIRLLKKERSRDRSQFNEVKGAYDFFHQLKSTGGIELGIATGSWEKSACIKLESIGIDPMASCFSNSDYYKSREKITTAVIDQLNKQTGATPERIIYFGDGEWDLKTCINLGIDFIGIDVAEDGKLRRMGAKTVFKDYSDAAQLLDQLNR